MDNKLIAERIAETFKNDTQTTIAEKISCSQGQVSKLIHGDSVPTVPTLIEIANQYGVSVDWLLGLTDNKNSIISPDADLSYSLVFVVLANLYEHGALTVKVENAKFGRLGETNRHLLTQLNFLDPALGEMLAQIVINKGTDISIFNQWVEKHAPNLEDAFIPYWGSPADVDYQDEFESAEDSDKLETMEDYVDVMRHLNKAQ